MSSSAPPPPHIATEESPPVRTFLEEDVQRHRRHPRHPRRRMTTLFVVIVQLIVTFAGAVVSSIVVVIVTAIDTGFPFIVVITSGAASSLMAIATSVVAVSPASSSSTHFVSHFCVHSRPIGGFGSNQGTVASTMMYGWSACAWMCRTEADSVNTTTSMFMMSSCRKYHGCGWKYRILRCLVLIPKLNPFSSPKNTPQPTFLTWTMVKKMP